MLKNSNGYVPQPIDTADVQLSEELLALANTLAANTHDVWAVNKMNQGFTYGPVTDNEARTHRDLIPYEALSPEMQSYDLNTSLETLKLLTKLGWTLTPPSRG